MRDERLRALLLAIATSAALVPSAGWAQDAPPVVVRFIFEAARVRNLFGSVAERDAAELAVSEHLAEFLKGRLQYWPARVDPGWEFPQLVLGLNADNSKWFIAVRLIPAAGRAPLYEERVDFFAPGEEARLGAFPEIGRVPGMVEDRVKAFYGSGAAVAGLIERLGACAPLGRAAHLSAAPIAILPLRWERYCDLASSMFALEYSDAAGERVIVVAKGAGSPADYTPENPVFRGLKAKLEEGADPSHLTLRFFRLQRLQPDPAACIDVGGLPPVVAP